MKALIALLIFMGMSAHAENRDLTRQDLDAALQKSQNEVAGKAKPPIGSIDVPIFFKANLAKSFSSVYENLDQITNRIIPFDVASVSALTIETRAASESAANADAFTSYYLQNFKNLSDDQKYSTWLGDGSNAFARKDFRLQDGSLCSFGVSFYVQFNEADMSLRAITVYPASYLLSNGELNVTYDPTTQMNQLVTDIVCAKKVHGVEKVTHYQPKLAAFNDDGTGYSPTCAPQTYICGYATFLPAWNGGLIKAGPHSSSLACKLLGLRCED